MSLPDIIQIKVIILVEPNNNEGAGAVHAGIDLPLDQISYFELHYRPLWIRLWKVVEKNGAENIPFQSPLSSTVDNLVNSLDRQRPWRPAA